MKKTVLSLLILAVTTLQAQKNTLLDQAFWRTNPTVATIEAEIAKGANPAELNGASYDPTVFAINAKAPTESILFLLKQKGNDVNKSTHDFRTYLHWAGPRGDLKVIEYLLANGADLTVEDNNGSTPLIYTATGGQTDTRVYDAFIKGGANLKTTTNKQGANILHLTIANDKDLVLTSYFLSKGLSLQNTDAEGNTVFNYAARTGNVELLKKLLEKGAKFTDNAMLMAVQGNRGANNTIEYFQYLESLGIKPTAVNKAGETALHILATKPKQQEAIQYFLSKGVSTAKADAEGNLPFMNAAATNRDTAIINILLNGVKNVNQQNKKGLSALSLAVRSNGLPMVQLLLDKKADKNVVDAEGNNLGYYLVNFYNPRGAEEFDNKVKLLQSSGANITAAQKNGNTMYHLAIPKNDLTLLQKISALNVDVNAKNKEGLTPLHKAVMIAKDVNQINYLLSVGAKKDITTEFKETAYDLAKENEYFTKNKISVDFLK